MTASDEGEIGSGRSAANAGGPAPLGRHVVNLRLGEFSSSGEFRTTRADVDRLFERELPRWIESLPAGRTPRLLFQAHGGLTRESRGIAYAERWHRWWLEQDVWPIYFVWETGLLETLMQLLDRGFGERGRGLRESVSAARNRAIEQLVHLVGQDLWATMKLAAERAAEDDERFGSHHVAGRLAELLGRFPDRIECHAIGHSAGAIFQAWFVSECQAGERAVPFRTLSLLAPACTVSLFDELLRERVDGERVGRLLLFLLDSDHENRDPTVPLYGRSLLHLVSRGLERERGAPLLGLEDSIRRDASLARFLGLEGEGGGPAVTVLAPSGEGGAANRSSGATTHGAFDEDPATLRSIALEIGASEDADALPPLPRAEGAARGDGASVAAAPLFEPLEDRLDEDLRDALGLGPAAASSPAPSPATAASVDGRAASRGARRALCIGIDAYPGDQALEGCVADARAWADAFDALGFRPRLLLDGEATRRGILDAVRALTEGARAGDVIAIQYSGHGVQFPDVDGDELDGEDEALVPADSAGRLFVADDELWEALEAHVDGVEVCVFMDCCHSRSNSRALPPAYRRARLVEPTAEMTAAHRERLAARGGGRSGARRGIEDMRHVKYSACADRELAYEERGRGNFSRAAIEALRRLNAPLGNDAMRLAIERSFPPDARQHPGLECATARRDALFLGGTSGVSGSGSAGRTTATD